jgi:Uma2 family endonuclease
MSLRPRYTFAEYLEIERRSREVKHEYIAGEIFAMAGGSVEHSALASTFAGLLFNHLRGGPCRTYSVEVVSHRRELDTRGLRSGRPSAVAFD